MPAFKNDLLGYRFAPTEEERMIYLQCKNSGQSRSDLDIIPEIDICKYEPGEIPAKSLIELRDLQWYFFCPKNRKYRKSPRSNRATGKGYWKATGKDREIKSKSDPAVIGMMKILVFKPRDASTKRDLTSWIIHEYRLPDVRVRRKKCVRDTEPESGFVLCRLFKKPGTSISDGDGRIERNPPAPAMLSPDSVTEGISGEPVAPAAQNLALFDKLLPDEASNPSSPKVRHFNGTVPSDVPADHEFNDTTRVDYLRDYPGELVIPESFNNGRDDFHVKPSILSGTEARTLPEYTYDPNGHLHDASIAVSLLQNFDPEEQIFDWPDTFQRDAFSRFIHDHPFMNFPILINDMLAEIAYCNYIEQNFPTEYECPSAVRGFATGHLICDPNDVLHDIDPLWNFGEQNFNCPSDTKVEC